MKLANVFGSIASWRKLSAIPMRPSVAYKILKYTNLVDAEYSAIEKQRVAALIKVANAKEGESVSIEPNTPEFTEFQERFAEILALDCDLARQCQLKFGEVIAAADEAGGKLSASDLAVLEPFFVEE